TGKSQSSAKLNLMPQPASVQMGSGSLKIDGAFSVAFTGYKEPRLERAKARFMEQLSRQTAIVFSPRVTSASKPLLEVHTDHASKEVQEVGEDESYTLEVTPTGAKLSAANPLGVLRGLQTFLQLVEVTPEGFAAPAVTIKDSPRFPWRGTMIDTSRH